MFSGPIFLVGRPRSGTKLLRELLNQHPEISIPFWESNFIPRLSTKAKNYGDLRIRDNFHDFFQFFSRIEFFQEIAKQHRYTHIVTEDVWYNSIQRFDYSGVIQAFYELYAKCDNKRIWGDKSPHYMLSVGYLVEQYPASRFIHIIRDVRDNCLSNMMTWNKNPYRCAQLWVDGISKCRNDAARYLNDKYLEIKYESLLEDPRTELTKICEFLNIDYIHDMCTLNKPVECFGDARGQKEILTGNKGKWKNSMPVSMIERIEAITFDMLEDLGYSPLCATRKKSLNSCQFELFRITDAWNRFLFDCRVHGGLVNAVAYQYRKRGRG